MKTIQLKFTNKMKTDLKNLIGKKINFIEILHDDFPQKNENKTTYSSFQNAWLNIQGKVFNLHNECEENISFIDDFETEYACFSFVNRSVEETPYNAFETERDKIKINEIIKEIKIVTDEYVATKKSDETKEKFFTDNAIIFVLENYTLIFERPIFWSEQILVTIQENSTPIKLQHLSNAVDFDCDDYEIKFSRMKEKL